MSDYRETLKTYVGATGRTLSVTINYDDGTAYDLTDAVAVTIAARSGGADGTVVVDDEAMTVDDDPTTGVVTWTPSATAVEADGRFDAQIRIEVEAGVYDFAAPIWFEVKPAIVGGE